MYKGNAKSKCLTATSWQGCYYLSNLPASSIDTTMQANVATHEGEATAAPLFVRLWKAFSTPCAHAPVASFTSSRSLLHLRRMAATRASVCWLTSFLGLLTQRNRDVSGERGVVSDEVGSRRTLMKQ